MSAFAYNELVIAAKRAEAAEEVVRALAAQIPLMVTEDRYHCALCAAQVAEPFAAAFREAPHKPTCPWLRSVDLTKELDQ